MAGPAKDQRFGGQVRDGCRRYEPIAHLASFELLHKAYNQIISLVLERPGEHTSCAYFVKNVIGLILADAFCRQTSNRVLMCRMAPRRRCNVMFIGVDASEEVRELSPERNPDCASFRPSSSARPYGALFEDFYITKRVHVKNPNAALRPRLLFGPPVTARNRLAIKFLAATFGPFLLGKLI